MIKYLFIVSLFLLSGCTNKNGISMKYYSDCNEYYDLQGYYHKECGDDIVTYKDISEGMYNGVTATSDGVSDIVSATYGSLSDVSKAAYDGVLGGLEATFNYVLELDEEEESQY